MKILQYMYVILLNTPTFDTTNIKCLTVFIFTHFYLRSDRADILKVLFVVSNDPNVVDLNVDIDVMLLSNDGVKFVDLVSTLVEDKDSELLGEPTVTVVDSVACTILLVLTSGVVDPVLTASLV